MPRPSAATQPEPDITLGQLARDYLSKHDGQTDAAVEALTKALLRDKPLLRSIIKAALHDAVSYRVEASLRTDRRQIMRTAGQSRDGVIALANGLSRALLDMPLANGLRLREASRTQVLEQASRYDGLAKDMGRKARWLELIGQSIPDGKTVGDVMDDARAAELWMEVQ